VKRKMYLDWKEYEKNGTSEHEEIHRAWVSSIKKGKIPLIDYKQKINTTLYDHQIEAIRRAFYRKEFALFMEQGTGKTYCALELILQRQVKTLVVCPKAVKFTWEREIEKFGVDADVINFRSLHKVTEDYDFVVVDESQKIKNPFSKQSKKIQKLGEKATYRLILTGTPYGNKLLDIFGQYLFLNPRIFGLYKKDFLNRYCVMNPFTPFPKIDGYKRVGEIKKKISAFSYVVKKKDVLDLPGIADEYIYVPQSKEYKEFKKKNVLVLEDTTVSLEHKLQLSNKLQQLCSGFLLHTNDMEEKETFHIKPKKKLQTLKNLLEDIEGKVVIFTKFQQSVKDIEGMLGECYILDGSTKDADRYRRAL